MIGSAVPDFPAAYGMPEIIVRGEFREPERQGKAFSGVSAYRFLAGQRLIGTQGMGRKFANGLGERSNSRIK
ncbi:MAG: hypothetical protein J0G95_17380 [Rhizobiales bacterium]|nr:hypothetical protein [Hyphomicrobiales bacterium]